MENLHGCRHGSLSRSGPACVLAVIEALAAGVLKEWLARTFPSSWRPQRFRVLSISSKHLSSTQPLSETKSAPPGEPLAGLYAMVEEAFPLVLINTVIGPIKRSKELSEVRIRPLSKFLPTVRKSKNQFRERGFRRQRLRPIEISVGPITRSREKELSAAVKEIKIRGRSCEDRNFDLYFAQGFHISSTACVENL